MMEQPGNREDKIATDEWMPIYLKGIEMGQTVKLTPFGFSMYPLLVGGRDSLLLKKIDRKLKRGDICLYRRDNGIYVTHTVYKVDDKGTYFLGESQHDIEGPLRDDQILALAEGFIRRGKEHSCDEKSYRFFHEIWLRLRPFRIRLIKIYRRVFGKSDI